MIITGGHGIHNTRAEIRMLQNCWQGNNLANYLAVKLHTVKSTFDDVPYSMYECNLRCFCSQIFRVRNLHNNFFVHSQSRSIYNTIAVHVSIARNVHVKIFRQSTKIRKKRQITVCTLL